MNVKSEEIWNDVQQIRTQKPLIHNITNFVVMNSTANALLSLGASPVMAHAIDEVVDMVKIASALVINIGTLSSSWNDAMFLAASAAKQHNIPIVFDPVGSGATDYRTTFCTSFLRSVMPTVIRGNASEIMAICNADTQTHGVDSNNDSSDAVELAKQFANEHHTVISISGETDFITDGKTTIPIKNGDVMMTRVTGLGCTATALTAAFVAVNKNSLNAAANAMAVMGICGEMALQKAEGPGTLQLHFLDALYHLTENNIETFLK